jgi:gamma-glutamyltranspeptidase / glutathione hydrolase
VKRIFALLLILLTTVGVASAQSPANLYGRSAQGTVGVVAAAKAEASQVGVEILKRGGNAVDAAIATAFALGVLEPNASGLGGGGFMLVKLANMKEAVVVDFREKAPAAASADMYKIGEDGKVVNAANVVGGLASGVPGEVAGLLYGLDKYGSKKLTRAQIMQPAINWAKKGFPVTDNLAKIISDELVKINKFPATAKIYTKEGLPYEAGDSIKNPDLAATLELIAKHGKDVFYQGDLAKKIVAAVKESGGIITEADLAAYEPKIRKPVTGSYRKYTIFATPPASSGGTHVIEILNILENFDMVKLGVGTPASLHVWGETMKLAFADRAKFMADTDFVKVPLAGLTDKAYAKSLAAKIDMAKPMEGVQAGDPSKYESGSTTSLSVMDRHGNMATITKSINYFFGSGVVVPGAGFIMNNHMDDFVPKPGSANSIEPGKRPLSSMSPTLVLDPEGKPYMTMGSPGATRIIGTLAEVISNVIDHKMSIQEANMAPRFFRMQSGDFNLEGRISINTKNALEKMGHKVMVRGDWDNYFGGVQAVQYDRNRKVLFGGADPRRDGQAAAY